MSLVRTDDPNYRWPDDAVAVARDMEQRVDQLKTSAADLATIARGHYAAGVAAILNEAEHDLAHALAHLETARRGLERAFEPEP